LNNLAFLFVLLEKPQPAGRKKDAEGRAAHDTEVVLKDGFAKLNDDQLQKEKTTGRQWRCAPRTNDSVKKSLERGDEKMGGTRGFSVCRARTPRNSGRR